MPHSLSSAKEKEGSESELMVESQREKDIRNLIRNDSHTNSERPRGILIISIIGILLSLLSIASAISLVAMSSFSQTGLQMSGMATAAIGGSLMVAALFGIVLGIIGLLGYFLLYKMKRTGFIIVVIFGIISIIQGIFQIMNLNFGINLISLLISILILLYVISKRNLFS